MTKRDAKPKFLKLDAVAKIYDINARTLRGWCLEDLRMKRAGKPEEGPFHGKSVKLGLKWFLPVAEIERKFREGAL